MNNIFEYQHPEVPEACKVLISPSGLYKFFEYPRVWYDQNILGINDFTGNEASLTGTICHYMYEQTVLNQPLPPMEDVRDQLDEHLAKNGLQDLDADKIMYDAFNVIQVVIEDYIKKSPSKNIKVETPVCMPLDDEIYVAGTFDRFEVDTKTLCDYKTVSTKPNVMVIPFNYKVQLLTYAEILRHLGYEVERIRLIYGIKPTKTLPARSVVVTETLSEETDKFIHDIFSLVTETIKLTKKHPEYTHLLFKSMELKK